MKHTRLIALLLTLTLLLCVLPAATAETDVPKIGYCVNFMSHEWYQNICAGAEVRAEELGVELLLADGNNDSATQISMCENLLASDIDVLIVTPIDSKALGNIVTQAHDMGVKVITESNHVENEDVFVGIDSTESGKMAGLWLADYATEHNIVPNVLIIGAFSLEDCTMRVTGFKEGLEESGIEYTIAQEVDGEGLKDTVVERATDALTAHPDVNAIFGINDDSTTGAMQAYRAAGLDESSLVAIGFGFEGAVGQDALLSGGPYKTALAMFPTYVGVSLVDAATELIAGEEVPAWYQAPTIMITADNFEDYYNEAEGGGWAIDLDAVRALKDQL